MQTEQAIVLVLLSGMVSGVVIILMAMRQRAISSELRHRERMAMIERGLVPSPEMDPRFQALMHYSQRGPAAASRRALTGGIVIIALGLGFMTMIGLAAGEPEVALGLGGAIAILGAAFVAVSFVRRPGEGVPGQPSAAAPPPPVPSEPPPSSPIV